MYEEETTIISGKWYVSHISHHSKLFGDHELVSQVDVPVKNLGILH